MNDKVNIGKKDCKAIVILSYFVLNRFGGYFFAKNLFFLKIQGGDYEPKSMGMRLLLSPET